MPQTSEDSIEVIWHRHPQVWALIALACISGLATTWALATRAGLLNDLQESRSEVRDTRQQLADALKDATRAASQHAKDLSTRADAVRIRDQRVFQLEAELTATQARLQEIADTRRQAAVQLAESESSARKRVEERLSAMSRNVLPASPTSTPPSFHPRIVRIRNPAMFEFGACRQQAASALTAAGVSGLQMPSDYVVFGDLESYRVIVLCLVLDRVAVVIAAGPSPTTAFTYTDRVLRGLTEL